MTDAKRLADAIPALVERARQLDWSPKDGVPTRDLVFLCHELADALTTAVEIGRAMGREEAAKMCDELADIGRRTNESISMIVGTELARLVRSDTLDVEALTETVAEALYLHDRPSMYAPEAQSTRAKATAVLRSLGIGGKE